MDIHQARLDSLDSVPLNKEASNDNAAKRHPSLIDQTLNACNSHASESISVMPSAHAAVLEADFRYASNHTHRHTNIFSKHVLWILFPGFESWLAYCYTWIISLPRMDEVVLNICLHMSYCMQV